MWENPRPNATYIVACDPSYGVAGWDRNARSKDDEQIDNCAIQVIRCGKPDVQVAEYAGPIDAEDAAYVVNFLGRMYRGDAEEEQALAIVEVQPGPGLLTQRELQNRFGYENLFAWKHLDSSTVRETRALGWYSSRQSRQMLWIRGTRHIKERKLLINSPWLVEEMTDCVLDNFLAFTARAQWGAHDDRVVSTLLGVWAANEWSFENAPEEAAKPEMADAPSAQASDMSAEELEDDWNHRFSAMQGY
jgi:hypothetical protein